MDPCGQKSLQHTETMTFSFVDINGIDGKERDGFMNFMTAKKINFYDSSFSKENRSRIKAQGLQKSQEPKAYGNGLEKSQQMTSSNPLLESQSKTSGYGPSHLPAQTPSERGDGGACGDFHSLAKPDAHTSNGNINTWNVNAPIFQPRGIQLLQKFVAEEQASQPKKNAWASSSGATLFQGSIRNPSTHHANSSHQAGADRVPVQHPSEKDRQEIVRAVIRGVVKDTENMLLGLEMPKGIRNTGFLCYFNCVLQNMLTVPSFASFLGGLFTAIKSLEFDAFRVLCDVSPICGILCNFWRDYTAPGHSVVGAHHASALIKLMGNDEFALDRQSDPIEFFGILISKIQLETEGVKAGKRFDPKTLLREATENGGDGKEEEEEEGGWQQVKGGRRAGCRQETVDRTCPLQRSFGGRLGRQKYHQGKQTENVLEPFYSLTLPINAEEITSVSMALKKFLGVTVCEDTKRTEKHCLVEIPETLVLSFGNTVSHINGGIRKISKQIELNEYLVLSEDMLCDDLKQELKKAQGKKPTYKLMSGFFHLGENFNHGHYISFNRNSKSGGWNVLDDDTIMTIPHKALFSYGSRNSTQIPHGLFYQLLKRVHVDMPEV